MSLKLGGLDVFRFRKNSTTVNRVIDDFPYRRGVGVDIHAVASLQVPHDAFSGNLLRNASQLRVPTGLNMIDSEQPLIQRQVFIESHDYYFSSIINPEYLGFDKIRSIFFKTLDASPQNWDAVSLQTRNASAKAAPTPL